MKWRYNGHLMIILGSFCLTLWRYNGHLIIILGSFGLTYLTFRHLQPMDVRSTAAADGCCSAWSLSLCILVYDSSVLKYVFFFTPFLCHGRVLFVDSPGFLWIQILASPIKYHCILQVVDTSTVVIGYLCWWKHSTTEIGVNQWYICYSYQQIRAIRQLMWARKWCSVFSFALVSQPWNLLGMYKLHSEHMRSSW